MPEIKQEERWEMTENLGETEGASTQTGFAEVVARALTDADFRESLYADGRATVLQNYRLSAGDIAALASIPRAVLEEQAASLSKSVGSTKVAVAIGIGAQGSF